jgi:thiol:disulfide interchange protein DsbD
MDTVPILTGLLPRHLWRSARAGLAALVLCGATAALSAGLPEPSPKLLPPEQAFRFSARALDAKTVEARFLVADGYYLYRDKLHFMVEPTSAGLRVPELPAGKPKHDEFFGDVETYRGMVVVRLALPDGTAGESIVVKADSQGCADLGVCYPPNVQQVRLALPGEGKGPGPIVDANPSKKGFFD